MAPASGSARIGSYVCSKKLHSTKTLEVWQSRHDNAEDGAPQFLIKRLLPELAENPRLVEQYVLRGQRATRLDHPGIAKVVDVIVEPEQCCIVSEGLDGNTLREILRQLRACDNALPVWFAVHVAHKLSLALEYAHQGTDVSGKLDAVYHQDVCPENVVVTDAGEVLLVDFGLSRSALLGNDAVGISRWSDSGEFDVWAPHFGDAHTDIQGLGRVLFELVAGRLPGKRLVPPSHYASWVSAELDQLVGRMLAASGPDRFANMQEVRLALGELVNRQRQPVDSSHLAGLLRLVMSNMPQQQRQLQEPDPVTPIPARSMTILPTAPIGAEGLDDSPDSEPTQVPSSRRVPQGQFGLRHDWDAAVTRTKTESQQPPSMIETVDPPSATESFERGLEKLKMGDLLAAEAAWLRALELDPNHRLCLVNLKLLRKLRDSELPVAVQ